MFRQGGDFHLTERDLVFFDTETTGLEFDRELIEIGFVKVRRQTFEILEEGDIKIKPRFPEKADPQAMEVNGYDAAEWAKDGVDLKEGMEEFLKHTDGAILVGHNLPFDWLRIEKALAECGLQPNHFYKGLDTFSFAWLLLGDREEFKSYSLRELADFFKVDRGRAHRAIDDAKTTYGVFLELLKLSNR